MLNKLGESLYHYTRAVTAIEKILPAPMQLMLGPYSAMRDPRESHQWMIGTTHDDGGAQNDGLDSQLFEALNAAKETFKVLSLVRDETFPDMDTQPDVEGDASFDYMRERFRFGYAHPRLWEHYASERSDVDHTGVCLCLNREALLSTAQETFGDIGEFVHGAVTYRNGPIVPLAVHAWMSRVREIGVAEYVAEHLENHRDELFFHKLCDWATETEYRLLLRVGHPDSELLDISSCLEAVICGSGMSGDHLAAIRTLCDPVNVTVFRMRWRNGLPTLFPVQDGAMIMSFDGIVLPRRPAELSEVLGTQLVVLIDETEQTSRESDREGPASIVPMEGDGGRVFLPAFTSKQGLFRLFAPEEPPHAVVTAEEVLRVFAASELEVLIVDPWTTEAKSFGRDAVQSTLSADQPSEDPGH